MEQHLIPIAPMGGLRCWPPPALAICSPAPLLRTPGAACQPHSHRPFLPVPHFSSAYARPDPTRPDPTPRSSSRDGRPRSDLRGPVRASPGLVLRPGCQPPPLRPAGPETGRGLQWQPRRDGRRHQGSPQGLHPAHSQRRHPRPHLRRQHRRPAPQGAGRGVLRHHLGVSQGADLRNAHRWSGDHEVGAEFVEAGEEGAVLGLGREVEDQVQDPVPVLPRVPERRGAIPAPEGRRVPGEGERGEVRGGRERPEHRQERQPRGAQVRPKASLRFVDITSSLFV